MENSQKSLADLAKIIQKEQQKQASSPPKNNDGMRVVNSKGENIDLSEKNR